MNRLIGIWGRAALICVALMVGLPGVAHAQSYWVEADCSTGGKAWKAYSDHQFLAAYSACGEGSLHGMKTYVSPQNQSVTGRGTASHILSTRPGTRITALQWAGRKFYGPSSLGWFGAGWAFKTGMFGDGFRPIDGEADCGTHDFGACYSQSGSSALFKAVPDHYVGGLNDGTVGFYTQCTPTDNSPMTTDGDVGHGYTRAALVVEWARVQLRDDWDPNIKNPGGSVTAGGWQRGTVDFGYTAEDNSGISHAAAYVDGTTNVRQTSPARDNTQVKPLPDLPWVSFSWDTSSWPDGRHTVWGRVLDAADRVGRTGEYEIYTDNHAPAGPTNLTIDGGEGWESTNNRILRWTNPDQGNG